MKLLDSKAAMAAVGVLAGGVVLYLVGRQLVKHGGDAAAAVGDAINPVNPENVFYRAANAVGDALDGGAEDSFSLGSWIYDRVDAVRGWFGLSDAQKQRQLEEEARARFQTDAYWRAIDNAEGIG